MHFVGLHYIIEMGIEEVGVWTGSSWLRTGTGGGHLWPR